MVLFYFLEDLVFNKAKPVFCMIISIMRFLFATVIFDWFFVVVFLRSPNKIPDLIKKLACTVAIHQNMQYFWAVMFVFVASSSLSTDLTTSRTLANSFVNGDLVNIVFASQGMSSTVIFPLKFSSAILTPQMWSWSSWRLWLTILVYEIGQKTLHMFLKMSNLLFRLVELILSPLSLCVKFFGQ